MPRGNKSVPIAYTLNRKLTTTCHMMTTVLAYDFRFTKRTYKMSTRCLLAILLYSCNPSPRPGEPSPAPEPLKEHTTPTQKENSNVAQRNATVSALVQPADAHASLDIMDSIELSSHSAQVEGHCDVVSSQGQNPDRKIEQLRSTAENNSETPLTLPEILNTKLNNPHVELTPNQSISLVNHCATLGEENAVQAAGKEVLMVLGNTGTGKSTLLNCLLGCKMKLVKPRALGLSGVKRVAVVDPESIRPEVVIIGHGKQSHTFMPQIVPDLDHTHGACCDCPGFSDNRGAEINIANAINTRRILQQARGVKAVFLTDYYGLLADRGRSIEAMANMCLQMFGSADNLRKHKDSVLLGITKAPLYEDDEPLTRSMVQSLLVQENTPIAQILANRIFLFDPLDRGIDNSDFWTIQRCRTEIAQLRSIPQHEAATMFQTVLTGDDQTKLKHIMRAQASALAASLERNDYQAAGSHWQSLARLRVIGNEEVETMVGEHALSRAQYHVSGCVRAFREYAVRYEFDQAERQLALLRMLTIHFSNENIEVSLVALESLLAQYKEKKTEEQRDRDNKLAAAKREAVQGVREEMEQKVQRMLAQLENALQQMNLSESDRQHIRTRAKKAGKEVLEGIGKN